MDKTASAHHSHNPDLPAPWITLPVPTRRAALAHPLLRGLFPSHVGYFPVAKYHRIDRPRGLDQGIFKYCVKGSGWCRFGAVTYAVSAGDLLVIPPGVPHAYGAEPTRPWSIHWFHAMGDLLPLLLDRLGVDRTRPIVRLGVSSKLTALLVELRSALDDDYAEPQLLYASQLLNYVFGVIAQLKQAASLSTPDAATRVAETVKYMKSNPKEPIEVGKLAKIAGLSPSRYRVLFQRMNGYSPREYGIRLRVHRAAKLLDSTNLSVKDIARSVGFEDPLYFSRVFRNVYERSPRQYRCARIPA